MHSKDRPRPREGDRAAAINDRKQTGAKRGKHSPCVSPSRAAECWGLKSWRVETTKRSGVAAKDIYQ